MNLKKSFSAILIGIISFNADVLAQTPVKQWDITLGGNQSDIFSSVIQTSDGGYIAIGSTTSVGSGDVTDSSKGWDDYWIVKVNNAGVKEWDKLLGGDSTDFGRYIKQTADGGYIVGGSSMSGVSGNRTQNTRGGSDFWILKLSSNGIKQWDARYGGDADEYLNELVVLADGSYILGGISKSGISGDKTETLQGAEDYWVVKISNLGVKQWDKRFGGNSGDYLYSIAVSSDGGYLLGGYSSSQLSGDKTKDRSGVSDYWVVKLTSTGVKQWDAVFGGSGADVMTCLKATVDGGYILGGYSNSNISGVKSQNSKGLSDYWIVKITSTGIFQWDATLGGSLSETMSSIELTSDGGFLLAGSSESGISGDKSMISKGGLDYWAVKVSNIGVKLWDIGYGGSEPDNLYNIKQTSDGGFMLAGYSWSTVSGDKSPPSIGNIDFWLVKVGSAVAPSIATNNISQSIFCPGVQITIPFIVAGTFTTGNVFTAQLSNSSGSFTSPITLGSLTSTKSGSILTQIPPGTTLGTGYKVRVVASTPAVIGTQNLSTLTIRNAPIPIITVNGTLLTATAGVQYNWLLNGSTIMGEYGQTLQATQNGNYAVFVTDKYGCSAMSAYVFVTVSTKPTISTGLPSSLQMCAGGKYQVPFNVSSSFESGNKFKAQLSNSSGSFSTPVTIGTLAAVSDDVIDISIPPATSEGNGYRIRVVADTPMVTGSNNGLDIQIMSATIPTIVLNGHILQSSPAQLYQWNLNGTPIAGATEQFYTATENGAYSVTTVDLGGCVITSSTKDITDITPPIDPCGSNPTYTFSLVKDIMNNPSYNSSSPRCFYKVADMKVFFCARNPISNNEGLYFTDGTEAGTILLKDNLTPSDIGNPVYSTMFCTFQGKMCFVGRENTSGKFNQVWISDGTPVGTYAITGFNSSLTINQLTVYNQKIYFKTYGGGTGALYQSNGTANSATSIESLVFDEYQSQFKASGGKLYLITKSKVYDYSNNTRTLIFNYSTNHVGCIASCEIVNGKMIYQSSVNCTGSGYEYRDVYEVDLSNGAERSLSSIIQFYNPVDNYGKAIVFKNAVYFYFNDNSIANEVNDASYIYKYDGNSLSLIHTNAIDSSYINFYGFTTDGNRLLYMLGIQSRKVVSVPYGWAALYETDGTASGIKKLFDRTATAYFNESAGTYSPNNVCILGNKVFFKADSLPTGTYPVSRLFYHDGANANKILPNTNHLRFNNLEMIPVNASDIITSGYITPSVGANIGAELWSFSCANGSNGVEEFNAFKQMMVYPNPTTGKITVEVKDQTITQLNVYNLVGELILTESNNQEIDLSAFGSGIYLLEVACDKNVQHKKVVLLGK